MKFVLYINSIFNSMIIKTKKNEYLKITLTEEQPFFETKNAVEVEFSTNSINHTYTIPIQIFIDLNKWIDSVVKRRIPFVAPFCLVDDTIEFVHTANMQGSDRITLKINRNNFIPKPSNFYYLTTIDFDISLNKTTAGKLKGDVLLLIKTYI